MCGRNIRLALVLALFSSPAFARTQNFVSGSPLSLGFAAGVERAPTSSFPEGTQKGTASSSHYFAIQPTIDFVNIALRLSAGWHFYAPINGSGQDASGANFTGNSSGGSFDLGARLMLSPLQNQQLTRRLYLVAGVGQSVVKLKNQRTYLTGANAGTTFEERVQGSGLEYNGGMGVEFFLLQNYSLQLEAGYLSRSVDSFSFKTTNDVTGATRSDGESALDNRNRQKGFHVYSPYAQLVLQLNL